MEPTNPYSPPQADLGMPPTPDNQMLAGRGLRFAGALLDGIFAAIPSAILVMLFFGGSYMAGYGNFSSGAAQPTFMFQLGMIVLGAIVWLGLNGYMIHTRGQTLGKMIVGTRIIMRDGSKVTLGKIFALRVLPFQLAALIPFVGGFVGLIDALMIFRANHACLHDDIAGTKVILAPKGSAA